MGEYNPHFALENDSKPVLDPTVYALQKHIEGDPELIQLFTRAFQEIPNEFQDKPDKDGNPRICDYQSMIQAINRAIISTPLWSSSSKSDCVIGCPINEALIWLMNTRTGFIIFSREDMNTHFAAILSAWGEYLSSPASLGVINDQRGGWLSKEALNELQREANEVYNSPFEALSFEEIFVCQPSLPSYGFKSWDDFFTRRLRPDVRPIAFPADHSIVINPCESQPLAVASDVPAVAQFSLKGTSYSLLDMLDQDPYAQQFIGGTVYQGWLSLFNYHRWHAAVSGRVVKILQIRGTYFAADPSRGFEKIDSSTRKPVPDRQAPDESQRLLSSIATRTVILIQADDENIGLVGFIAIGMSEVSSCVATVAVGEHVHKGQDIGSFHYGGSSYCLLFERAVKLRFSQQVNAALGHHPEMGGRCIAVNSELARL